MQHIKGEIIIRKIARSDLYARKPPNYFRELSFTVIKVVTSKIPIEQLS